MKRHESPTPESRLLGHVEKSQDVKTYEDPILESHVPAHVDAMSPSGIPCHRVNSVVCHFLSIRPDVERSSVKEGKPNNNGSPCRTIAGGGIVFDTKVGRRSKTLLKLAGRLGTFDLLGRDDPHLSATVLARAIGAYRCHHLTLLHIPSTTPLPTHPTKDNTALSTNLQAHSTPKSLPDLWSVVDCHNLSRVFMICPISLAQSSCHFGNSSDLF
jgi:hypothetical protein